MGHNSVADLVKRNIADNFKDAYTGAGIVKAGTNIATLGTQQYNINTGKWETGVTPRYVDEGAGALDGANTARTAQASERDRIAAAQAQADMDFKNQQLKNYQSDLLASRTAQATRNTAAIRSGASSADMATAANSSNSLGGSDTDSLGS